MEFSEVIKDRFSCKKFSDKVVEDVKLNIILESGRLAPTAKNLQEQHIYVARSKEWLEKSDNMTPCRYGSTTVLVVAFDKTNVYTYPGGTRDSGVDIVGMVSTSTTLISCVLH